MKKTTLIILKAAARALGAGLGMALQVAIALAFVGTILYAVSPWATSAMQAFTHGVVSVACPNHS